VLPAHWMRCQGRNKKEPVRRSKREPVIRMQCRYFGGERALERSGRGLSPPSASGASGRREDFFSRDFA
jgi:hypothetical protein